jgi:hypothetical protein
MLDRTNRKGGRPHAASTGITLKDISKAHKLCLTEFMRTRFIRHKRTLRVCGKQSCFEPQSELAEKGKSVLQLLALQESDNYLPAYAHPLNYGSLSLTSTPVIPHPASPQNLQHSFALSTIPFLLPLTTLICTKNPLFFTPNSALYSHYPKGAFLSKKAPQPSLHPLSLLTCTSLTPESDIRRAQ